MAWLRGHQFAAPGLQAAFDAEHEAVLAGEAAAGGASCGTTMSSNGFHRPKPRSMLDVLERVGKGVMRLSRAATAGARALVPVGGSSGRSWPT